MLNSGGGFGGLLPAIECPQSPAWGYTQMCFSELWGKLVEEPRMPLADTRRLPLGSAVPLSITRLTGDPVHAHTWETCLPQWQMSRRVVSMHGSCSVARKASGWEIPGVQTIACSPKRARVSAPV